MENKRIRILLITVVASVAWLVAGAAARADDSDLIVRAFLTGAPLNGFSPSGEGEHRTQVDGSRRLRVEVEDVSLPAGTVLNVQLNGASIGSLTINTFRQGELEIEGNNGQVVPNVSAGMSVVVKTQAGAVVASGAFGNSEPKPSPSPDDSPSPTPSPSPGVPPGASPSPSPEDRVRATVQFAAAGYNVTEGTRSIAVTVTRVGDLSRDSKVDYRSVDSSAHERTDYTTAAGRLFFAAGEGNKTITVLITEDGFVEQPETFFIMLFDASRSTELGVPGTTTITIADNDTAATASNPVDQPTAFITQHYMDFLNREPEPEGLKAWEDVLKNCEPGDNRCDRIEVSSAFYRSPEFQDRGYFLYRFYSTSLGRIPHYAEFEKDMSRTSGFYTPEQQEANKTLFADDFITRQEFIDRYGQYVSAADYVNALMNTAGVILANRETLIAALENGHLSKAQTLRAISESQEVRQKFASESFVVMQYFGYLRRDPDPLYREWIRVLDDSGDYRTMINGFIGSVEYRHRFGNR